MMVIRFKSKEDHKDVMKKVKKMKEFIEDLEDCLEDVIEEDADFRGGRYRDEYDDEMRHEGRYAYHRGGSRRM